MCTPHRLRTSFALLVALSFASLFPGSSAFADGRVNPIPPSSGGCYVGAFVASGAAGMADFNTRAGKRQALFLKFVSVGGPRFGEPGAGGSDSVARFCESCYANGAVPYLTIEPWNATSASLLTTSDELWIKEFAGDLGALHRPAFIRFGHEMNGDWYPWGWAHVTPDVYVQGFRDVAAIFHQSAPRAAMVWAPSQNWGTSADDAYSQWYPGDEYVDWVGLTSYQWSYSACASDQFVLSVANGSGSEGDFYATFAQGRDKPMMIAETACGDDDAAYYDNQWTGGTQNETGTYGTALGQGAQNWWIKQVYSVGTDSDAVSARFPLIKAITWFAGTGDYGIGGTDPSRHSTGFTAYSHALSDPYWLANAWPSAPDTTPPTTTAGKQSTYVGTATVTIEATDNAGGSEVWRMYYVLDGGVRTESATECATITVGAPSSGSELHNLQYWSVDAATNREATKTAEFRVASPETSITLNPSVSSIRCGQAFVVSGRLNFALAVPSGTTVSLLGAGAATALVAPDGFFTFTVRPERPCALHVSFSGGGGLHASESAAMALNVVPAVSTPRAFGKAVHTRAITISGSVAPRPNDRVVVTIYKAVRRGLKRYGALRVSCRPSGAWSIRVRLPKGDWRIRASSGGLNSGWGRVKIR